MSCKKFFTDIKFFDEEMSKYHKYLSDFKNNPKLKEIMKDLDKHVDILDNWYQKEDLDNMKIILKSVQEKCHELEQELG